MLDQKLEFIYGVEIGRSVYQAMTALIEKYRYLKTQRPQLAATERLTQRDVVLITYGDQIQAGITPHLQTLHRWLQQYLKGIINTVHILPFYPYTSDDGFSVVDYRQIDPALGDWVAVQALHSDFKLMFDAVINHISASSAWFQDFLQSKQPYDNYFIVTDPTTDLSQVTRPRTLPLLTRFQTAAGPKYLWTTFSPDQLDLNYQNPDVLLNITELLLFYVSQGADLIRLDAIGYLWKQIGTNCIHLPQTHAIVQIWREVLDECAADVVIVTETNVPHHDNISYLGDGSNEAQMVYQFPLVPLALNAIYRGDSTPLREWATSLEKTSDTTTFFNFLASHDGIGVVPAKGLLSEAAINELVEKTLAHGGQVSYKNNPDGSQSAYELNITLFDALSDPNNSKEDDETKINRFLVVQSLMLTLRGVPGIYFHSLLGSHNWQAGLSQTGRTRTINRQKLQLADLEKQLDDSTSHAARVFSRYIQLIRLRTAHPAFHPNALQQIITLQDNTSLFIVLRIFIDKNIDKDIVEISNQQILGVHNISNYPQHLEATLSEFGFDSKTISVVDVISNQKFDIDIDNEGEGFLHFKLDPYQFLWLTRFD